MAKHCRIVTAEAFRGQRVSGRGPGLGQRWGQHEQSGELVTIAVLRKKLTPRVFPAVWPRWSDRSWGRDHINYVETVSY